MVIYELYVGTFTPAGTFAAVVPRRPELKQLGVNAVELMPVAEFPGERNWGYDGVYPFAPQHSYGGPEGLKQLVKACHEHGLAVILDVVYNHFGPEGCYIRDFAPYYTRKYHTPWGEALNFDDAHSDGVRNYFLQNVRHWFEHYRVDALRLDAVHAIFDFSPQHILRELAAETARLGAQTGRKLLLEESGWSIGLPGRWRRVVDSADAMWGGPGSKLPETAGAEQELTFAPLSVALFERLAE
jgi:maltooligosyltrehalose trehalohydrolase